jgi:hypothetical protein
MIDSTAACARGRTGPSRAGEAGRSRYQKVSASPMTPIHSDRRERCEREARGYPWVIRVRGVVESVIYSPITLMIIRLGRRPSNSV